MRQKLFHFLKEVFAHLIPSLLTENATSYIEQELEELENVFAMLVFAPLVGYPIVPPIVSLKFLPYMEEELLIALDRSLRLDDQYSLLGFDIE